MGNRHRDLHNSHWRRYGHCFFWGQFRETSAQTDILAISGRQARRDSAESGINTAKQIAIAQQQANAAQESVKAIRRQFAFAQRPWIQVDTGFAIRQSDVWVGNDSSGNSIHKHPSEFMKFPNQMILGDSPVDFTATFRNTGLSPAINEWQVIQMKFVDLPSQVNAGYSNVTMLRFPMCHPRAHRPKTNFVVFQNLPYSFSTSQLPDASDIEAWVKFKKMLVIYGCVRYDDQLGGAHQTDFCSTLDRTKNPVQWASCPSGNGAQ